MSEMRTYEASLALFDEARTLIPGGSQTTSKRPSAFAEGAYPIYSHTDEDIDAVIHAAGQVFADLAGLLRQGGDALKGRLRIRGVDTGFRTFGRSAR